MLSRFISSDQMGNKGAFITLDKTLKPKFTSYAAVVSMLKMAGSYWVSLKHVSTGAKGDSLQIFKMKYVPVIAASF